MNGTTRWTLVLIAGWIFTGNALASTLVMSPTATTPAGNTWTVGTSGTTGGDQLTVDTVESTFIGAGGILLVNLTPPTAQTTPINSLTVTLKEYCTPGVGDCQPGNAGVNVIFQIAGGAIIQDTQNISPPIAGAYYTLNYPYVPGTGLPWTWTELSNLNIGLKTWGNPAATYASDYISVTVTYNLPNSYTYYVSSFCGSLDIVRRNISGGNGKPPEPDTRAALASFLIFWGLITASWAAVKRLGGHLGQAPV